MGRSGTLDKSAYPAFVMSAEAAPESPQEWDPQSDPDWQSDEEVAYHEAGHAVVAYALGGQIMSMTVEDVEYPEGIERGRTRHYITGLDSEIQCRLAGGKATLIRFGNRHGATTI